jgi:hypothetical protein
MVVTPRYRFDAIEHRELRQFSCQRNGDGTGSFGWGGQKIVSRVATVWKNPAHGVAAVLGHITPITAGFFPLSPPPLPAGNEDLQSLMLQR